MVGTIFNLQGGDGRLEKKMELEDVKEVLNEFLIKTNFKEHNKKEYIVSKEDMIRLLMKFVRLIERVSYENVQTKRIKEKYM